ncbi:acyl-CoA/acyl-ACP dehydrogenase [Rhodococcus sp. 14C212]|uniref:acyl-CoA dehydrogenase family protein n=1 Tax=Rhodococcus sp. 14C212 TaxID=2711209 RepID=UPI0013EA6B87|nr:acyl-CoA dehydrogenase family protein [Rhodococcus sp. 14C212]NGP04991.1 acyl-CoA/acyl-ACP dehydrogenase [Rhodococcus sp. 14C212]
MSEIAEALAEAVSDACERYPSPTGLADGSEWNAQLWSALDQIGITLLSVPEEQGGSGGDVHAAATVLRVLGQHWASVPLAETALQAAWLLGACHATIPEGPMAAAAAGGHFALVRESDGWVADGELIRVPWARIADHLVVLTASHVAVFRRDELEIDPGTNVAGEPRDRVVVRRVSLPADRVHIVPEDSGIDEGLFIARGALARMAMLAGAAQRSLEMSLTYASEREQFGRSLDKFQSVQHQIAEMAGEVLLCKTVAESAAMALDDSEGWQLAISAGKVTAAEAAGNVARIAHQIHGAIGFTEEHDLRQCTTRIWSWRDECGAARNWAEEVGALTVAAGADGVWSLLSGGA